MKHGIILIVASALLLTSSCSKLMNYNELTVYDKDYITQTYKDVGGFITGMYNAVPYDWSYSGGAMLAAASDECEYSIMGNGIEDFFNGSWGPTNAKSNWSAMYSAISNCNDYLDQMLGLTFDEYKLAADYDRQMYRYHNFEYEARFMRAYFYFMLVRQYGDVPMISADMSLEQINSLSRTPADDVFQFIFDECNAIKDKIIKDYYNLGDLALSPAEPGRVNQRGVLALRAQAALYWASPLFNKSNDASRWRTAATYYKELIAACEEAGNVLDPKYDDLWATKNHSNTNSRNEIIFARRIGTNNTIETNNYPIGIEGGTGGNCPSQNLVDAYDMKDGTPIDDPQSGYDPQNPYANRDPRLALTVAVDGDKWPTVYNTALQLYEGGRNAAPLTNATTTGYYLKKLCHGAIDLRANSRYKTDDHSAVIYRLGQAYLDYAECVFRVLGSADATSSEFPVSARELANKTRIRAGVGQFPAGMSNDVFWERYKKERMVELAFEGHRFWDVRRWKEADKYKDIKRMKITREGDKNVYKVETVTRAWNDKMYLFPVPYSEILKNPNLAPNNPGWE